MKQFERLELLIGTENLEKLKNMSILVIGLGGVGSYVVESLIRSGVGTLILVDYDTIDITNLNRQLMTNLTNIGKFKTDELEKRCKTINENSHIIKINNFIDENNIDVLFKEKIDYLIDCQDTINTKKLLIKECLNRKIKFITCMGMGNKLDPSKLEIIELKKTNYDRIAKILRKWVKEEKINKKIMCCCSSEKSIKVAGKIIGSTSFVPSSAGLLITSFVINDIIKESN